MNKTEQSIIQGQKKMSLHFWWNPGIGEQPKVMTGNSKELPVFPEYRIGGTGELTRIESYVRKQYKGKWYLIPIITQFENKGYWINAPEYINQHQMIAYKNLLFYKLDNKAYVAETGFTCEMLDENQEDEHKRLMVNIEHSKHFLSTWIKKFVKIKK